MNNHLTSLALAFAAATAGLTAQTTVSLTPTKDNSMYSENTSNSNGQGYLFCGVNGLGDVRRCLMHFDVAGNVPAGAVVIGATLDLNVAQSPAFLPTQCNVHRATQDWGEGGSLAPGNGGAGTSAQSGDATWNHAFFSGTTWTNPGGDFDPAFWSFDLVGLFGMTTPPVAGLIADVQDMLDNPANNYGWLFKLNNEAQQSSARRISARNYANPPTLNITYLLQSEVGTWGLGCPTNLGNSTVEFSGAAIGGQTVAVNRTETVELSVGADFYSLGLNPVGVTLQPNCTVYLPLGGELISGDVFLSAAGSSSGSLAVPSGYPGFMIACQTVVLDASPLGLSLSNAAVMILQ